MCGGCLLNVSPVAAWPVSLSELNDGGVPCPSHVDPERNSHRSGEVWTLRTVAAILANPRYTGRQVWNRQVRDHDAHRAGRRRGPVHRWNPVQDWVISKQIVHPPLVTEQDFVTAQAIRAARSAEDGTIRAYLLAGLVRCRPCGRRMDAHWVLQFHPTGGGGVSQPSAGAPPPPPGPQQYTYADVIGLERSRDRVVYGATSSQRPSW
jgi:Recombinase